MRITIKDILKNKFRYLKYRLENFKYSLKEYSLQKLGLRPTHLAEFKPSKIDGLMHEWKEFSGAVVAFGDCDGFAKICTVQGVANIDMPEGWFYAPPEYFLLIEDDGKIIDLWLESKKEKETSIESEETLEEKTIEQLKDEVEGDFDDRIFWIVNCKAGHVCLYSKFNVRAGFWTRIVSTSLEAALNKTYELWNEEHKLSNKEKEKKNPRDNFSKVFLDQLWSGDNPIYDLTKYEIVKGDYIEKLRRELDPEDWYNVWRLLKERQEDLTEFTEVVRKELEGIYPIFDQYIVDRERRYNDETERRTDSETGLVTFRHSEDWDDMITGLKREEQLKDQMIESVKSKFKRP